ncbi:MAG: hypothetical protein RHS_5157 [Robinsoniella sp. RHS]|nr:MAG: hypothetical protein RHS_5157 [Robinsoniella sp. RHS]
MLITSCFLFIIEILLHSGQICCKVGRADGGNEFSNTL